MNNKNKNALISVYNKKGISEFARVLATQGYKIFATEGTGKKLRISKIPYRSAEKISKNPTAFNDCIKTISFHIEAGILFDRLSPIHINQVAKLDIKSIDIVVCNFVDFKKMIKKPADFNIKNIDVGGPLMVRSAATNYKYVLVVVDPRDYRRVSQAIVKNKITDRLRHQLAAKAFLYTCAYDDKLIKYLKKIK